MQVVKENNVFPSIKNTVLTMGIFDGVHFGHKKILESMQVLARENDASTVLISFEPHPRKFLFPDTSLALLSTQEEKIKLLEHTSLDYYFIYPFTQSFASLSARAYIEDFLIKKFHPSIVVIGYDHHFGKDRKGNIALLQEYANRGFFKLIEIPKQQIQEAQISSSEIRKNIEMGLIQKANSLLGHPYFLKGKVIKGLGNGRKLGYPTANLHIENKDKLIPNKGVYAVWVQVADDFYKGVINIGLRPTLLSNGALSIEAYILNFAADIYHHNIGIYFIAELRKEKKFEQLEGLQKQIKEDITQAEKILVTHEYPLPSLL